MPPEPAGVVAGSGELADGAGVVGTGVGTPMLVSLPWAGGLVAPGPVVSAPGPVVPVAGGVVTGGGGFTVVGGVVGLTAAGLVELLVGGAPVDGIGELLLSVAVVSGLVPVSSFEFDAHEQTPARMDRVPTRFLMMGDPFSRPSCRPGRGPAQAWVRLGMPLRPKAAPRYVLSRPFRVIFRQVALRLLEDHADSQHALASTDRRDRKG
jgi:hypothetical protein